MVFPRCWNSHHLEIVAAGQTGSIPNRAIKENLQHCACQIRHRSRVEVHAVLPSWADPRHDAAALQLDAVGKRGFEIRGFQPRSALPDHQFKNSSFRRLLMNRKLETFFEHGAQGRVEQTMRPRILVLPRFRSACDTRA